MAGISDRYPPAERLKSVSRQSEFRDRVAIARQWLSEGIPYAFQECPAIYESMRTWLGWKLGVVAKDISLVGSARLGSSLAPYKLGAPFGRSSDLDLFAVSEGLFQCISSDFFRWNSDFRNGHILPRHPTEEGYWIENKLRGRSQISRGFLDLKMIPTFGGYDSKNLHDTMWQAREKLIVSKVAPKFRKVSLRCYCSWGSFERQSSRNLLAT